jgi:hypothetical protein
MNTTRVQTAQVPGKRSKTIGDHVKSALPWLGGALALGAAGAGTYYGGKWLQNELDKEAEYEHIVDYSKLTKV